MFHRIKFCRFLLFLMWVVTVIFMIIGLEDVCGQDAKVNLEIDQKLWLGDMWSDIPEEEVILSDIYKIKISIENSGDLGSSPLRLYYEIPCYSGYPLTFSTDDLLVWEDHQDHYENSASSLMPGEILEREVNLIFNQPVSSEEQYCISHIRVTQDGVEGEYYEDYALIKLAYESSPESKSGCLWNFCDLL